MSSCWTNDRVVFIEGGCSEFLGRWNEKRHREEEDAVADDEDDKGSDCYGSPSRKRRRLNSAADSEIIPAPVTPPRNHFGACRGGLARLSGYMRIVEDSDDEDRDQNVDNAGEVPSLGEMFRAMTSPLTSSSIRSAEAYDETSSEPPVFFPISNQRLARPLRWGRIATMCIISFALILSRAVAAAMLLKKGTVEEALAPHIIPTRGEPAELTLRQFLLHDDGFSLGMAPAFFGFYGYFGTLAAWEEAVDADLLQPGGRLTKVAGASAGAMAAILLSAGISPLKAAKFCAEIGLSDFADFPGTLAIFRGNKFERVMEDILARESPCYSLLLEDAILPVAVSAFDLQTMAGQILTTGSMARAARASATFPFLFQPVSWNDGVNDYTLIDGGIADTSGVAGLIGRNPGRVVNLKIGPFLGDTPPLPSQIEGTTEVVSISLQNMPQPHPWNIEMGPIAVQAASRAMKASLDLPLLKGKEKNHYELHIDASTFWSAKEKLITTTTTS